MFRRLRPLWMNLRAWMSGGYEQPRRPQRRKSSILPEFERLEDRTVPASFSFTNPAPIALPGTGTSGVAGTYPSTINVSGLTGSVGKVTVTLHNLSHTFPDDLDILLVSPSGRRAMLMSDVGGSNDLNNVTLTFDDAAPALPDNSQINSGTFRPTDFPAGETMTPPAPAGPYGTSLAEINGSVPNGPWQLFIVDDSGGDSGILAGGWALNLTSQHTYHNGQNHTIPGTGTSGPASVYPSTNTVYDLRGEVITKVTVKITGLTHTFPGDIDILLVGPTGQSVILMSDVGGNNGFSNRHFTFDDDAARAMSDTVNGTGTYRPTNFGGGDSFPAPAPAGPYGTTLSVFNGTDPYGTWSLYIVDDSSGDSGFMVSGWDLNLTTTSGASAAQNLEPGDYDGDGKDDLAVFRPGTSSWFVLTSSTGFTGSIIRNWGQNGDVPIQNSDFDGDGRADIAVFRPVTGAWFVLTSSSGFTAPLVRPWGAKGDLPLQNTDLDGDGRTDMVVWRPTLGSWFGLLSSTNFTGALARVWGQIGDIPQPHSDFDGDGKDDMAVYRPSNGAWFVLTSSSGYTSFLATVWGSPAAGDIPLTDTDFDGDGRTDMAVWRPNGAFLVLLSSSNFTAPLIRNWGVLGDVTVGGDFDNDGRSDMAVYRPSNGGWFVLTSTSGYTAFFSRVWGIAGDIALPIGDFDGLGGIDIGVWRPSTGTWFVLTSGAFASFATPIIRGWGAPGDIVL